LVYKFSNPGTYYLRVYGSQESGGEYADYRLTAGEMPQVDYALPNGGRRGAGVGVDLHRVDPASVSRGTLGNGGATGGILSPPGEAANIGVRLPLPPPAGVYRLHVESADSGAATVPAPFVVCELPEITVSNGAARRKADPLPVELPVIANGVLETAKAADYF